MSPLLPIISYIYLTHFTSIREARIIFKAGKNRDGFFDADDLLQQVDKAIDIFEGLTKGWAQGLFLFDNAPSHQKRAPDAISARHMVKGESPLLLPLHVLVARADPKANECGTRMSPPCNMIISCRLRADFSYRAKGRVDAPS